MSENIAKEAKRLKSKVGGICSNGFVKPGLYTVDCEREMGKGTFASRVFMCAPVSSATKKDIAGEGKASSALVVRNADTNAMDYLSLGDFADEIEKGDMLTIDDSGNFTVAWCEMFEAIGVDFKYVSRKLSIDDSTSLSKSVVRFAYNALAGKTLLSVDIRSMPLPFLKRIADLCLAADCFLSEAKPGIRILMEAPKKDDNTERFLYAFSLGRKPCSERMCFEVRKEELFPDAQGVPSCYEPEFEALRSGLENVCRGGCRPVVLIKCPTELPSMHWSRQP